MRGRRERSKEGSEGGRGGLFGGGGGEEGGRGGGGGGGRGEGETEEEAKLLFFLVGEGVEEGEDVGAKSDTHFFVLCFCVLLNNKNKKKNQAFLRAIL